MEVEYIEKCVVYFRCRGCQNTYSKLTSLHKKEELEKGIGEILEIVSYVCPDCNSITFELIVKDEVNGISCEDDD